MVFCRIPDETEEKYEEGEEDYDEDLENILKKTEELKPKGFPYKFYLLDEESFDKPIFKNYSGQRQITCELSDE